MQQLLIADRNGKILDFNQKYKKFLNVDTGEKISIHTPLYKIVQSVFDKENLPPVSKYIENLGQIIALPSIGEDQQMVAAVFIGEDVNYQKLIEEERQRKKALLNLLVFWKKIILAEDVPRKMKVAVNAAKNTGWEKITFCYNINNKIYYSFAGYIKEEEADIENNIANDLPDKLENLSNEMINNQGIYYIVPGFKRIDKLLGKDKSKHWKPNYIILVPLVRRASQYAGWLMLDDPLIREEPAREEFMTLVGFFQLVISELDVFLTNRELINLQKEKETLLRGIAHDIKNPLTVISGYANTMLRSEVPVDLQKRFLTSILLKSNEITKMIEDLLELSHLQNLNQLVDITSTDLKQLIREAYLSQVDYAYQKEINLVLNLPKTSALAEVDKNYMKRAIENLLNNAVKYSNCKQKVIIDLIRDDPNWIIKIQDKGMGLEDKDVENIFNEFYRSDRVSSIPGTGLGLSLVKRIIQLHQAEIKVESKPGQGSVFTIII
ncbi:MAG: sensor histidine kinase [bacterium]